MRLAFRALTGLSLLFFAAPPVAAQSAADVQLWRAYPEREHSKGTVGERFTYVCPPNGTLWGVYGTDVYTYDTSVCSAAVHAGIITLAAGGRVMIEVTGGQASYTSSDRNGVSSYKFNSYDRSFAFVRQGNVATPAPTRPADRPAPGAPTAPPSSPSSAPAGSGIRLELEEVTADTKNAPANVYKVDVGTLTVIETRPYGTATYRGEMPKVIDNSGPQGKLSLSVRAAARSRFAPSMGFHGEVEPETQVGLTVVAEPGESKSETRPYALKPRVNYSDGYSPVMRIDMGDVTFYFKYRVIRGGSVAAPAPLPGSRVCATPGVYLEQIGKSLGTDGMDPNRWTTDLNNGTATFTPPYGRASYRVEMPTVISPEGAQVRMAITMSAARSSRFSVLVGFLGEVEPESQVGLQVTAEPGESKSDTKTFTIQTRRNYSDNYEPNLVFRFQDGPQFYYRFRVVRCPR